MVLNLDNSLSKCGVVWPPPDIVDRLLLPEERRRIGADPAEEVELLKPLAILRYSLRHTLSSDFAALIALSRMILAFSLCNVSIVFLTYKVFIRWMHQKNTWALK